MANNLYEYLLQQGLAKRSIHEYTRVIRSAEAWFDDQGTTLQRAGPALVHAYSETLPLTWATRHVVRSGLRHYWLMTKRKDPPLKSLRVPKKPPMVCRAIDEEDAKLLAKAARHRGDAKGLAIALGLYLALRREEIATLRWAAFNGGWVTILGKADRSRTLPVHPAVLELLAAHPRTSPWVFPGRIDGHVCTATIWHWSIEVAEAAGVGHVPTHVLRHTALATSNDATGDLRSVQAFAGHASPEMTAGYTRATKKRLTAVMESLDY